MNNILEQVLTWPIIVQGALGSALFWLVLVLGQKTIALASRLFAKALDDKYTSEAFALFAWSLDPKRQDSSIRGFFICLYAAVHYLIKALIVLVVVYFVLPLNHIFATVGGIVSFYYLFRALSYVPHLSSLGDVDKRLNMLVNGRPQKHKSKDEVSNR